MSIHTRRLWTGRHQRYARALLIALCTLLGASAALGDATPSETPIARGIEAYRAAMQSEQREARVAAFHRAERAFESAINAGGASADLYANLGNAALQGDRLGPAVLAYRRALLVDPANARALQNLRHARRLLPDWVPVPAEGGLLDSFFVWHRSTSLAGKRLGAAVACLILALGLGLAIARRSSIGRNIAIGAALVLAMFVASAVTDPTHAASQAGVIISEDATARAADSINAPRRFSDVLPSGTEVRVLENRGGWYHIELHNGRNAWVTASSVATIAP
jgi:tetratricopeptide (TPR) repeat protein